MTIEQKNIAIAEMLRWKDKDGDFLLPKCLESGYDYREWCGTKNAHIQEDWMTTPEQQYDIAAANLIFHSDANWQFEAINWIENLNRGEFLNHYEFKITRNTVDISFSMDKTKRFTYSDDYLEQAISNKITHFKTRKEAIFEALYQFSQYLKEKK